ncbi:BRO family protein, partial [Brucella melitensis]
MSEAGLYKLILKSRKKEAQKFQNWLARDVIPEYLAEISAN